MRLLIVSNTYPPADISGVASFAQETARYLHSAGYEVDVLTRKKAETDELAIAVGGSKWFFPLLAARKYRQLAREKGYDVVHVHESDGLLVARQFDKARRKGEAWAQGKLVATLQVSYDEERRQICEVRADGERVAAPTWGERWFALTKARMHAYFGRSTVQLADKVVAPSKRTREELVCDYGAKDVAVIYNGISIDDEIAKAREAFEKRQSEGTDSEVVIYAGRMRTRKAVAVLLHAFQRVIKERPKAELWLIGEGEQYKNLQALHEEYDLGKRVKFLGKKNREGEDGVFSWLSKADVYCLPSRYEGFPVATLEAMAIGLPVVSTTVSGIPEQVRHDETGFLVEPEASDALADALIELLADPEKRRRFGKAGQEWVAQDFTVEKIAADYLKLWENLASEKA